MRKRTIFLIAFGLLGCFTLLLAGFSVILLLNQQKLAADLSNATSDLALTKDAQKRLEALVAQQNNSTNKTDDSTSTVPAPTNVPVEEKTKLYTNTDMGFEITVPESTTVKTFAAGVSLVNDKFTLTFTNVYPNYCPVMGGGNNVGTFSSIVQQFDTKSGSLKTANNGQVNTLEYTLDGAKTFFCGGMTPTDQQNPNVVFIGIINNKFDGSDLSNPVDFEKDIKPVLETYKNL